MAMAPAYPKKPPIKPRKQMRQLHWGKVPDMKVKGTMWEKDVSEDSVKVDVDEIEDLFSAAPTRERKATADGPAALDRGRSSTMFKAQIVTLVDPKTSNNTAIALSRFRSPPKAIADALLAGDEATLNAEMLSSLQSILPTAEDVELVQGFDGPPDTLGKAEQFFLAIAKVPRYTIRTKCMLVRANYPERAGELKMKLEDVAEAVHEVRNSKAFRTVLEHALAFGNYLNGGTNKGAAWGFKVESLNKLIGTKTTDGKSTLLHYLAKKLAAKGVIGKLIDQMQHLEGASRVEWKEVGSEVSSLGSALKQVETQVKLDKNASFTASMGAFHVTAKEEHQTMAGMKEKADGEVTAMIKWLGEEAKVQPEEVFSNLHNFLLALEKGHRYNLDCEEKEAKRLRQEEAQKKRADQSAARASTASGGGGPGGKGKQLGVNSELAGKLAGRNQAGGGLIDNAVSGARAGLGRGLARQGSQKLQLPGK
jgi:diaphanous 1